jgi:hypothetical protein
MTPNFDKGTWFAIVLGLAAPACETAAHAHPGGEESRPASLARAARTWQPLWRGEESQLLEIATAIHEECGRNPWPDAERCPSLLMAIAFKESSWDPSAIGGRGEVGLMQIHGRALAGVSPSDAAAIRTNLRLGLAWLNQSAERCRHAGWEHRRDFDERVLGAYASGECSPSRGGRLALRWARQLHRLATTPETN